VKLHELRPPEGARTRKRRVGRGTGSGRGKTSGRGQKGQLARSQGFRLGFEGGQLPLAQRLPKLGGFKNPFKKVYAVVNLSKLNRFQDGATVEAADFYEAGLARTGMDVKLLGAGKLRRKLTVTAHAASESARAAIEARGGKLTVLEVGPPTPGAPADAVPPTSTVPDAPTLPVDPGVPAKPASRGGEGGGPAEVRRESSRARRGSSKDVAPAQE
jgi:large subunit ribosomal protein L15